MKLCVVQVLVSKGLLFKIEITVENSDLPVVMYPDIEISSSKSTATLLKNSAI
jgi:hypothetical protein